jgi:eukaryotic translation initiation factor 2C
MSAAGSASGGAGRSGSAAGAGSPAKLGRSRSGSTSKAPERHGFNMSTYPLRDKEGISKRLDLPAEAYYHVSIVMAIAR